MIARQDINPKGSDDWYEPCPDAQSVEPHRVYRLFGFQWGVMVARRFQFGFPAYRSARIR